MGWSHSRLPIQPVPDRLVDARELAGEMQVSVATVYRLKKAGMPHIKFSPGTTRYRLNEAMAWCEEQFTPTKKAA